MTSVTAPPVLTVDIPQVQRTTGKNTTGYGFKDMLTEKIGPDTTAAENTPLPSKPNKPQPRPEEDSGGEGAQIAAMDAVAEQAAAEAARPGTEDMSGEEQAAQGGGTVSEAADTAPAVYSGPRPEVNRSGPAAGAEQQTHTISTEAPAQAAQTTPAQEAQTAQHQHQTQDAQATAAAGAAADKAGKEAQNGESIVASAEASQTESAAGKPPERPAQAQTAKHENSDNKTTGLDALIKKATEELTGGRVTQPAAAEAEVTEGTGGQTTEQAAPQQAEPQEKAAAETAAPPPKTQPDTEAEKASTDTKPQAQTQAAETRMLPRKQELPSRDAAGKGGTDKEALELLAGRQAGPAPVREPEVQRPQQTPAPAPAQPPEQTEQIRAQITRNLEDNNMEFQMQLKPAELGRVNVKIVLEGGRMAVEIAAAQPKSAELLQRQAAELITALKASGVELSTVNVVTAGDRAAADMNAQYDFLNNGAAGSGQGTRQSGTGGGSYGGAGDQTAETAEGAGDAEPRQLLNRKI